MSIVDNEIIPRKDKLKGSVLHIVWAAAQWPTPVAMPLDIMILRMQQEHLLLLQQPWECACAALAPPMRQACRHVGRASEAVHILL